MSKIRDAVYAGIKRRTEEFNMNTFPQCNPDWTDQQKKVFQFLNGESGGFKSLHESDKPEIAKIMSQIAGIDIPSKFTASRENVTIPPFTAVVLRETYEGYPSSYPLVQSRILGLLTETGTGHSYDLKVSAAKLRPCTVDEINRHAENFPNNKLSRLYGAIDFPDVEKLKASLVRAIIRQTKDLASCLEYEYPEGITEKGKQILPHLGQISAPMKAALSIILEDPTILQPYKTPPVSIQFNPFCAIVPLLNKNSHSYKLSKIHIQAGLYGSHDVLFREDDEGMGDSSLTQLGNHMDSETESFRVATDDEIKEYVQNLKPENLYLYVEALTPDQIENLLA